MIPQEKRQAVEAAIYQAVPETMMDCSQCGAQGYDIAPDHAPGCDGSCRECPVPVQVRCADCGGEGRYPSRPNTLEDVLRALMAVNSANITLINLECNGNIIQRSWVDGEMEWKILCRWHLGKPLSEQSDEVIEFLHSILCV